MQKSQLDILGMLAAVAVSAAGASSAVAAFVLTGTSCTGGAVITACYATTEKGATLFEYSGEEPYTGKNDPISEHPLLLAITLGEEVHIECTAATTAGTLEQAANLTAPALIMKTALTFTGCALLEPLGKKCTVPATLVTKPLEGTYLTPQDVDFAAENGPFIELLFSNNGTEICPATIKGGQPITGTQLCEATAVEEDLAEHLEVCNEEGSELKLSGSPVKFLGAFLTKLTNTTDFSSISKEG